MERVNVKPIEHLPIVHVALALIAVGMRMRQINGVLYVERLSKAQRWNRRQKWTR